MDSQYLESYLTVVEHGSIAEAARRLGLTPSTVAQRVRALEYEIGEPLLERAGRTVTPTPSGRAILQHARVLLRVVAELSNLAHEATQAHGTLTGELRLAAIPTAITGLLPPILDRLRQRYPRLFVHIVPGSSVEVYDRVVKGEIDAGILVKPPFLLSKAYAFDSWREEPLLLIAPLEMAGRDPIDLLSTEPFIRMDRTNWAGRVVDDYLSQLHIAPKEARELSSLEAIAVMVARGAGVALVPDWTPPWPEGLKLARMSLPNATRRQIGFLTRQTLSPHPVITAFAREAEQVLRSLSDLTE
jgi:DNA-binding transcriptional LysR family regulator